MAKRNEKSAPRTWLGLRSLSRPRVVPLLWLLLVFSCGVNSLADEERPTQPTTVDLGKGWHPVFARVRGDLVLVYWTHSAAVQPPERSPIDAREDFNYHTYYSTLSGLGMKRWPLGAPVPALRTYCGVDPWPEFDAFGRKGEVAVTSRYPAGRNAVDCRATFNWPPAPLPPLEPEPVRYLYDRLSGTILSIGKPRAEWQWRSLPPRGKDGEILFGATEGADIFGRVTNGGFGLTGFTRIVWWRGDEWDEAPGGTGGLCPCPFRGPDSSLGLVYLSYPDSVGCAFDQAGEMTIEGRPADWRRRPKRAARIELRRGGTLDELAAAAPEPVLESLMPVGIRLWHSGGRTLWLLVLVRDGADEKQKGATYEYRGLVGTSRDWGRTWTTPREVFRLGRHDVTADLGVRGDWLYVGYAGMTAEGSTDVHVVRQPKQPFLEGVEEKDDEDKDDNTDDHDEHPDGDRKQDKHPGDDKDLPKGH